MKITASQLRRIIKEEVSLAKVGDKNPQRFLHGFDSGHPMDDEGYMAKSRMADIKEMAATICGLLEDADQLPAWCQDLIASAHTDLEHVKDYMAGDEKLRSYKEKSSATTAGAVQAVTPTVAVESHVRKFQRLSEGHARITEEELAAWKSGDWGYVSEHDGGFRNPRKNRGPVIPTDEVGLQDYILRNYQGACEDLGCDDVSDPIFKEYVRDMLAGMVDPAALERALATF